MGVFDVGPKLIPTVRQISYYKPFFLHYCKYFFKFFVVCWDNLHDCDFYRWISRPRLRRLESRYTLALSLSPVYVS